MVSMLAKVEGDNTTTTKEGLVDLEKRWWSVAGPSATRASNDDLRQPCGRVGQLYCITQQRQEIHIWREVMYEKISAG